MVSKGSGLTKSKDKLEDIDASLNKREDISLWGIVINILLRIQEKSFGHTTISKDFCDSFLMRPHRRQTQKNNVGFSTEQI